MIFFLLNLNSTLVKLPPNWIQIWCGGPQSAFDLGMEFFFCSISREPVLIFALNLNPSLLTWPSIWIQLTKVIMFLKEILGRFSLLPVESQSNSGDLALNRNPKERNSVPAVELGRLWWFFCWIWVQLWCSGIQSESNSGYLALNLHSI